MASPPGRSEELSPDLVDDFPLLLGQSTAQDIGAARRQAGERLADLQNVLLVNHQPEGAPQARGQRRMRIGDELQPLIATGEPGFLLFIGRARTDHADNGDQAIDIPHVAHAAEAHHGRTFNVVNRARPAAGDHFPDGGVAPHFPTLLGAAPLHRHGRLGHSRACGTALVVEKPFLLLGGFPADGHGGQVHRDAPGGERLLHVAHRGQPALGQDIDLDQADDLHGIHVVVGGGISFAGNKGGRQLAHRLAGEHDAAGMHFGVTREAIEKLRHLQGRSIRVLVDGQVAAFLPLPDGLFDAASAGVWKVFREPPDLVFGNPQHLGHVGDSAPGLVGGKTPDHRGMFRSVFLKDEIDHVIFAIVRKVEVDVRQLV